MKHNTNRFQSLANQKLFWIHVYRYFFPSCLNPRHCLSFHNQWIQLIKITDVVNVFLLNENAEKLSALLKNFY